LNKTGNDEKNIIDIIDHHNILILRQSSKIGRYKTQTDSVYLFTKVIPDLMPNGDL